MSGQIQSFLGSPSYNNITTQYPAQLTSDQLNANPLITQLKQLQGQAQTRATSQATAGMYNAGLGRSSFTPQISGQAGVSAAAPYTTQIAQTGNQLDQQNFQRLMSMLGLGQQDFQSGIQQNQFQQSLDWQKQLQAQQLQQLKDKQNAESWLGGLGLAFNSALKFFPPTAAASWAATAASGGKL